MSLLKRFLDDFHHLSVGIRRLGLSKCYADCYTKEDMEFMGWSPSHIESQLRYNAMKECTKCLVRYEGEHTCETKSAEENGPPRNYAGLKR